ncbi:MAG: hypothetical protein FD180_3307 [Planctomycetota bacterium]|nr:MAG: hypothetical protein FD180_3307 [Planctomycetota bacterium]
MRVLRSCFLVIPLFPLLAGCHHGFVTVEESPPPSRVVVVDRHPPSHFDVVVDAQEDDVSFVVYREYYDCTDEEVSFIPYYRRYYRVDDCDLFFLFHVARHSHRPIDVVIRSYYYDCGRDYDRLIVTWRVDRAIFFVDLPGSYHPSGPFDRPYRLYREHGLATARFTNTEFRVLVSLKIGVEYQGVRAEQVIDRVREVPAAPHRVILRSHESLGANGRNVQGQKISVRAARPWTMPEKDGQKVRQERKAKAVGREKQFEEQHRQRVTEIRKSEEKPGQRPKDAERERDPKNPKDVERERDPKHPKDVEREKDAERQKQIEREKQLEREKELERQKQLEREKAKKDPKAPKKPK